MLNLDLNLWYLDDGNVDPNDVFIALNLIIKKPNEIGLESNHRKCEISILGEDSRKKKEIKQTFEAICLGIIDIQINNSFILGSPFTDQSAVVCLDQKINDLQKLTKKLRTSQPIGHIFCCGCLS